ncbi:MAG: 5'-3' exonuclease H3TH domain-containing protein [Myxococcota bacterium]
MSVEALHVVDGTYELFRAFYGAPSRENAQGEEIGAVRALAGSLLALVTREGATHVGVAFDHVIESFRNDLFEGYKTGAGIDPKLWGQFRLAEEATRALGFVCWPMVEFEADDALATAAHRFAGGVGQVRICSPDKDLMQCVRGSDVVVVDRRRNKEYDEAAVAEKIGVAPTSIPDFLALVGDDADGIPGVPRWGAKSTASVLATYTHLEKIPALARDWTVAVRGRDTLAENLATQREDALLYRTLATLRTDVPLEESLADMTWRGARRAQAAALAERLEDAGLMSRIPSWAED